VVITRGGKSLAIQGLHAYKTVKGPKRGQDEKRTDQTTKTGEGENIRVEHVNKEGGLKIKGVPGVDTRNCKALSGEHCEKDSTH